MNPACQLKKGQKLLREVGFAREVLELRGETFDLERFLQSCRICTTNPYYQLKNNPPNHNDEDQNLLLEVGLAREVLKLGGGASALELLCAQVDGFVP